MRRATLKKINKNFSPGPLATCCPLCGVTYSTGQSRRLVDCCGHSRCYGCLVLQVRLLLLLLLPLTPPPPGLRFERRIFHSMFAMADQKEGMGAFIEKRKPEWTHQ